MQTGIGEAVFLTAIMALVILFCRVCPFLFFGGKKPDNVIGGKNSASDADKKTGNAANASRAEAFIVFIEKTVPPLAMTVLAFNTICAPVYESVKHGNFGQIGSTLIAAAVTVITYLWKRNALLSIFSGTAAYMVLERVINF